MRKKLLLILMGMCCISLASIAQLTTGNNTANVVRNGNRAEAGDFGLYFGVTSDLFKNLSNPNISTTFMPLVNLKYMQSDNFELRIGIELDRHSLVEKGTITSLVDPDKTLEVKSKTVNADHIIYPGIAYHFSKNNILDVYVGAELPLGYTRIKNINDFDGDNSYQRTSQTYFNIGLGGFVGLQAYIANLPIAIGLEYGLSTMFDLGNKIKVETKADADSEVQTVYQSGFNPTAMTYKELNSARRGELGSQFRFTLTYFFKN